jgi:hypothetical protein
MNTDYSERETERARQAERTSAGFDTQRLATVGGAPRAAGQQRTLLGLALIAFGVVLMLARFAGQIDLLPGVVLLSIGSGLLFFAFWQRIYGLLIPGCILAGLSVGVPLADVSGGASVLWGLALGFMTILLVGRAWFGVRSPWPVFPAVPLFLVGVIVAATQLPGLLAAPLVWLPLALVALGLRLGWQRRAAAG